MKKMFENKGMIMMGAPRPSDKSKNNNDQNLGIMEEKTDKLAIGYNPVDDLEKKLEKVVIQKNKKKKKKPTFEG